MERLLVKPSRLTATTSVARPPSNCPAAGDGAARSEIGDPMFTMRPADGAGRAAAVFPAEIEWSASAPGDIAFGAAP
jgi:hypothetical protein